MKKSVKNAVYTTIVGADKKMRKKGSNTFIKETAHLYNRSVSCVVTNNHGQNRTETRYNAF